MWSVSRLQPGRSRSFTSPSIVLPRPFQQLFLDCISGVHSEYRNRAAAGSAEPPGWATLRVPGLDAQIWSDAMYDTLVACYVDYYDKKHVRAVLDSAPDIVVFCIALPLTTRCIESCSCER